MMVAEGATDGFGFFAIDGEGDNATLFGPQILHGDLFKRIQLSTQMVRKKRDACPDDRKAPFKGIVNGDAEADFAGVAAFPSLEAACIGANLVLISCYPLCGAEYDVHQRSIF